MKKTSKRYRLNLLDAAKALLVFVITAVLQAAYTSFYNHQHVTLRGMLEVAIFSAIGYLLKNYFTPEKIILDPGEPKNITDYPNT